MIIRCDIEAPSKPNNAIGRLGDSENRENIATGIIYDSIHENLETQSNVAFFR